MLHYNTVNDLLKQSLFKLMSVPELDSFRLVGGTSLSLQIGHRILLPKYNVDSMIQLHKERYEYNHDRELILQNFTDFSKADDDFEPICLRGKYWEFIKEDLNEAVIGDKK